MVITGKSDTIYIKEFVNLSIGGCLIQLWKEVDVGDQCYMKIPLSAGVGATIVEVKGEIVRQEDGLVAIRFNKIEPESLHHLQHLIRHNASDPDQIDEEITEHPGLL